MPLLGTRGAGSAKGFGFSGGRGPRPFTADYLMIAGGGAGNGGIGGGGGAGGLLFSFCNACAAGIGFDLGTYDITIGGGGAGALGVDTTIVSQCGALACISKTATGGGYGSGVPGGSGSGTNHRGSSIGAGNTPAVPAALGGPQGNNGGTGGNCGYAGSGGGGRGEAGIAASTPGPASVGGRGGAGISNSITGSSISYAGGGGGGKGGPSQGAGSPCGTGGAGVPGCGPTPAPPASFGTTNRGGGGGGNGNTSPPAGGGSGGSGVVVLRYPNAIAPSITIAPGTNTTAPVPGCQTAATFTVSGTFTVG